MAHRRPTLSTGYFLIFAFIGVFLPYFNLYCYHLGFNGVQIGILSASQRAFKWVSPFWWGPLADRSAARKRWMLITSWTGTLILSLLLWTDRFIPILIIMTLYAFFNAPIIPMMEATTMEHLEKQGGHYGRIRLWGSIGFIVASLSIGRWLETVELDSIIPVLILLSVALSLLLHRAPQEKREKREWKFPHKRPLKRLRVFLIGSLLMQWSHGAYYGFFSIHLENIGFSPMEIGALWTWGVIAEIVILIYSDQILKRWKLSTLLKVSLFAAAVRWAGLAYFESAVMITLFQTLHALSFGSHHAAAVAYADQSVPAELRTTAQSYYSAWAYGAGGVLGFFTSGILFDQVSVAGLFWISAAVAGFASLLAILSLPEPTRS